MLEGGGFNLSHGVVPDNDTKKTVPGLEEPTKVRSEGEAL